MITFFNKQQLSPLLNKSKVKEKSKKETSNTSFKGLSQDTFELRSSKNNDLAFRGKKSKTVDDIREKLLNNSDNFKLSDNKITIINDSFNNGTPEEVKQAEDLTERICKNCKDDVYDKLAEKVIQPLLQSQNRITKAKGIKIINETGKLPPSNEAILEPIFRGSNIDLTKMAITALGTVGMKSPNSHAVRQILPFIRDESKVQEYPTLALEAISSTRKILSSTPNAQNFVDLIELIPERLITITAQAKVTNRALLPDIWNEANRCKEAFPNSPNIVTTCNTITSDEEMKDAARVHQQLLDRMDQIIEEGTIFTQEEGPSVTRRGGQSAGTSEGRRTPPRGGGGNIPAGNIDD